MICEAAPAKLNLYLHVGPVRTDGLHALDSLFVFTEHGDQVCVDHADTFSLKISGPFAKTLAGFPQEENLVWKAAEALKKLAGVDGAAALMLEKHLPIAAGIGGGSADAAAALRALVKLWNVEISDAELSRLAFELGADIPACLAKAPVYVSGAGEELSPAPKLPPLWVCLVNPLVEMPTGPIFQAFDKQNPAPVMPDRPGTYAPDIADIKKLMANSRNDLESMAMAHAPVVSRVLSELGEQKGVVSSRMSGSGATCFGLFGAAEHAALAAQNLSREGWWTMASPLSIG